MESIKFKMTGLCPLLMHNIRLANPLDPIVLAMKSLTAKKSKMTEDERSRVLKFEWYGALYHSGNGAIITDDDISIGPSVRVVLPANNIEAAIADGAKKTRKGKLAKAGLMVVEDAILDYQGPKDVDRLYGAGTHALVVGVRNQQSRIMRMRPMFRAWSADFAVEYDPMVVNGSDVLGFLVAAGREVGIGDWRPKFGRFTVEKL